MSTRICENEYRTQFFQSEAMSEATFQSEAMDSKLCANIKKDVEQRTNDLFCFPSVI